MGGKNRRVSPISTVTSEGHREAAVDDAGLSRFVAATRKRRSGNRRRLDSLAGAQKRRDSRERRPTPSSHHQWAAPLARAASNPPQNNWFVEDSVQFGSIASSRSPATQGGFVKSVRVLPDM